MKPHNLNGLDACVFFSFTFSMRCFYSINETTKIILFKHFRPLWSFHWELCLRVVVSASHYMTFRQQQQQKILHMFWCEEYKMNRNSFDVFFFYFGYWPKWLIGPFGTFRFSSFSCLTSFDLGIALFLYIYRDFYNLNFMRFFIRFFVWFRFFFFLLVFHISTKENTANERHVNNQFVWLWSAIQFNVRLCTKREKESIVTVTTVTDYLPSILYFHVRSMS